MSDRGLVSLVGAGSGTVVIYTAATTTVYDDFERLASVDWGASTPTGATYEYPTGVPGGVAISAYHLGYVDIPADVATMKIRLPSHPIWQGADGFIGAYDFETTVVPSVSGDFIVVDLFHGPGTDPAMDLSLAISSNAADGIVVLYDGSILDSAVKTDWLVDTRYRVKFERRPATRLFRAKIWPVAGSEPGWLVSGTTQTTTPLNSFLQFGFDSFYPGDISLTFDNITFTSGADPVLIYGR